MSLPSVSSLDACADFSKTVSPFVPQLYELSSQMLQSIPDLQRIKEIYLFTNPLIFALALALHLAPVFLVVSEYNKNYSQVDRLWSILPTVYNAHFVAYAHLSGLPTQRLNLLLLLNVVWSVSTSVYWRL